MGQAPRELTPHESSLHFFGAELRHWRTMRGLSHARLGALTHYSSHTIGKIESASRRPTVSLARRLDVVLETGGVLERLLASAPQVLAPREAPDVDSDDEAERDLSLGWSSTPADTVGTVTGLWRADMRRRTVITTAWVAAALVEPVGRWLVDPADREASHAGGRRVGKADVGALWSMCAAFADADHQLGGGHARGTLIHYADQVMAPLLKGTYSDATGRQLFAAAARLCDVAGFMCFDSGRQGLGQKYYIQALRMAKISDDQALGGHVLADLSMQAQYLRDATEAVALADAAVASAARSGSASTLARCYAIQARAFALAGEAGRCDAAINRAEHALSRAMPSDEPFWIRFFTPQQLATESMYAAADLDDSRRVRHHAQVALTPSGGMQRRQVLATTTLAGSFIPGGEKRSAGADVDEACRVLREVLPTVSSLTSARALSSINGLRQRLAAFGAQASIVELERDLHQTLLAA